MKRFRTPKAKPGELKMVWGKLPRDNPDIIYCYGPGVPKCDSRMLHYMLGGKRVRHVYGEEREKNGGFPTVFDNSFIEELEARGYDITTIKFSIQLKQKESGND